MYKLTSIFCSRS